MNSCCVQSIKEARRQMKREWLKVRNTHYGHPVLGKSADHAEFDPGYKMCDKILKNMQNNPSQENLKI